MVASSRIRLFLAMITLNFIFTLLLLKNHMNARSHLPDRKYTAFTYFTSSNDTAFPSGNSTYTMSMVVRTEKSVSISERRQKVRVSVTENQSMSTKDDANSSSTSTTSSVVHEQKHNSYAFRFDETQGQFDPPHKFKVHTFVVVGDEWSSISRRKACIATQTSLDRSHWLMNVSSTWAGPISVSLFTPDVEFDLAVRYVTYLRECFPNIRKKVSFHFSYPVDHPPRLLPDHKFDSESTCEDHKAMLDQLLSKRPMPMLKWRESMAYPQNLLRNMARQNCPTEYVLCSDVDMIPNPALDLQLEDFLSRLDIQECRKCAYVIPVYEIKNTSDLVPVNKSQLLGLIKKQLSRRFHVKVFVQNQKLSDLGKWEKIPQAPVLDVAYDVKNYSFFYEPVYVAKADVPAYDTRFVGFGMTRNTQVYEMFLAGYKFQVLNNAFLAHWGFQSTSGRPKWRNRQTSTNYRIFRDFVREISVKYDKDPLGLLKKHSKSLRRFVNVTLTDDGNAKSKPVSRDKKSNVNVPDKDKTKMELVEVVDGKQSSR